MARIEKILDGTSLASSIQPYMNTIFSNNSNTTTSNPNSESSRVKTALRLYKKMQTLVKSKIVSYRQPFAWAARPVFKRSTMTSSSNYELDSDAKFSIYKQEDQHLSDDDLLKYLGDFRLKEKYKLVSLGGDLNLVLKDFSTSSSTDSSSRFY